MPAEGPYRVRADSEVNLCNGRHINGRNGYFDSHMLHREHVCSSGVLVIKHKYRISLEYVYLNLTYYELEREKCSCCLDCFR